MDFHKVVRTEVEFMVSRNHGIISCKVCHRHNAVTIFKIGKRKPLEHVSRVYKKHVLRFSKILHIGSQPCKADYVLSIVRYIGMGVICVNDRDCLFFLSKSRISKNARSYHCCGEQSTDSLLHVYLHHLK